MLEQAKSQINSNKYNDAEKTARLILKKQPANYPAHNILGLALQGQQRYEDAIAVFKQATKFSAKDIAGWLNLGNTYFLQKKFDDAEKYFEIVLSLDKKNIHALRHLSFISAPHAHR
jgi:Flp pilus assembly protein TadD